MTFGKAKIHLIHITCITFVEFVQFFSFFFNFLALYYILCKWFRFSSFVLLHFPVLASYISKGTRIYFDKPTVYLNPKNTDLVISPYLLKLPAVNWMLLLEAFATCINIRLLDLFLFWRDIFVYYRLVLTK